MAARLEKFKELLRTSRQLDLSSVDIAKLFASYYTSRLPAPLRGLAPDFVVVKATFASRAVHIPLRLNGIDCSVLSEVFLGGVYDVQCDDVHAIVDLGANIGLTTLYLSIRYPSATIASIEPMEHNVRMLRETIVLNGVNSQVFAGAIGVSDGFAELAVSASPTVHSLVPGSVGLETVRVPTMSMPSLMATMGWNTIDLLKIDIEGYEKTLFGSGGEWLSATKMIVGEAHAHVAYGLADIQRDLEPYGFVVRCESHDSNGGMIIFTARRQSATDLRQKQ